MNIKNIKIWLKELINTPSVSVKNIKDSNISIKINGKEKINKKLFIYEVSKKRKKSKNTNQSKNNHYEKNRR